MPDAQPKPTAAEVVSTAYVRDAYIYATGSGDGSWTESRARAEFYAWLAEHDAQVAAQALRDAAAQEAPAAVEARRWLRARADRITAGDPA